MTTEEIKSLQEIQGTGGFRIIQFKAQEMLKKVDSVREIKKDGLVAEQALARQLTYEVLEKFLSEINLISSDRETRKTYE